MTLTAITAKVYNAPPEIEKILRKNQNGLQRNRSTISKILRVRRIIEV